MVSLDAPMYSKEESDLISLDAIQKIQATYDPGHNREVTPQNVYQEAVLEGQPEFEDFADKFLLPGSRIEGLENVVHCMNSLEQGRSVLLLPEHRGNMDAPTFHVLVRREGAQYDEFLRRLVYIAGRKLNESSDFVRMFTQKYSRLVIVPRRDLPAPKPGESAEAASAREAYLLSASRINRAAFRQMVQLKKAGKIFVLFPLGGRLKPDADNIPVRETTSYLRTFDEACLVSMEGNLLPPRPNMDDERPRQDKVVYRVGKVLHTDQFLAGQRRIFDNACEEGQLPLEADFEQFTVERIMKILESLRINGDFDPAFPVAPQASPQ